MQHWLLSFVFLMKLGKKTTTNMPCPFFFFFLALHKTMTSLPTHRRLLKLKNFFFLKHIEAHKRTTSLPARHCPLQPKKKNLDISFSWVARDDEEPLDSSSSLSFLFLTCKKRQQAKRLIVVVFFPHLKKMTMS